jgi:hypothetical protein
VNGVPPTLRNVQGVNGVRPNSTASVRPSANATSTESFAYPNSPVASRAWPCLQRPPSARSGPAERSTPRLPALPVFLAHSHPGRPWTRRLAYRTLPLPWIWRSPHQTALFGGFRFAWKAAVSGHPRHAARDVEGERGLRSTFLDSRCLSRSCLTSTSSWTRAKIQCPTFPQSRSDAMRQSTQRRPRRAPALPAG